MNQGSGTKLLLVIVSFTAIFAVKEKKMPALLKIALDEAIKNINFNNLDP